MIAGQIETRWLERHYPSLQSESVAGMVTRLWNPSHPEQEMVLYPVRGQANVLSYHCQQTFYRGEVEDFGSWDDHSKPWRCDWPCWRDAWLSTLVRGSLAHVRPGRDSGIGFLRASGIWAALIGWVLCSALAQAVSVVTRS